MEVGDYVRTKQGRIGKISNLTVDYSSELILCEESSIPFAKHQIIKSSPNIIDLIEVGDYVNGKKVVDKQYHYTDEDNYDMGEWCIFYENVVLGDYQYDINSIVTKEQFESMEYKVGD